MHVTVETDEPIATVDITDQVSSAIPTDSTGQCTIFVEHTTAGVLIQENEPRLRSDIESILETIVPDSTYAHDELDGNARAHLQSMLLGPSLTIPIVDGDLLLGTWQSIMLVDCDGPRTRRITVTTVEQ